MDCSGQVLTCYHVFEVSVSIRLCVLMPTLPPSHGGNTGSNPVGDAKVSKDLVKELQTTVPVLSRRKKPTELTAAERAALAGLLRETIARDRFPLSPRIPELNWRHDAQPHR